MIENGYCTLSEFKAARGGDFETDITDDGFIERLIESASKYIDDQTGWSFAPRVETLYLDYTAGRGIRLPRTILEVITLTNGDGVAVTSDDYNLYPLNFYPKIEIRLKESSSVSWEMDGNSNTEGAIDLVAITGFHNRYTDAWKSQTTLNEGGVLNATDVTFTVTSAAGISPGNILRIENELMIVSSISGSDITVDARGANGSTAATHADTTTVKLWRPMRDVYNATLEMVTLMYGRRSGVNASGESLITGAGVVITPRDVPRLVRDFIAGFRDYR